MFIELLCSFSYAILSFIQIQNKNKQSTSLSSLYSSFLSKQVQLIKSKQFKLNFNNQYSYFYRPFQLILYDFMSLAGDSLQKRQLFSDQPRLTHTSIDIVKLFDGFFLTNIAAVKDTEFVYNNKITLIVNLAPQQIRIEFPRITIISFQFGKNKEGPQLNIASVMDILAKIDCCLFQKYEGVVLLGKGIESRTMTLALLYTMIKFRWSLTTAWKLLQIKRQNIDLTEGYYRMLQEIDKNQSKAKLSEAIDGNSAQEERIILQNTIKNSEYKNMPNFFGLSYRKEDHIADKQFSHVRKVSFTTPNHQIINPIPSEKKKTNNFQKRLRQFIRQKCQTKQEQSERFTVHLQSQDQCMMIKNKDIVGRIPRRKIASKTQQSPMREDRSPSFALNNFIEQKQSPQPRRSTFSQLNAPAFHMQLSFFGPPDEESFETNRKEKGYYINSKKAKVPKKCITQDSFSQFNIKKQQNQINGLKAQQGNLFKISKSNKNSYKKIKARALGKQSDKCIRVEFEQQQSTQNRPQKVYNVNLNLQIESINFTKQIQRESKQKQQKPRLFARQHPKKISRILRSQMQEQN